MTASFDRPAPTIRRDPLTSARASLHEASAAAAVNNLVWSMNLFTALRKLAKVFEEHVSDSESDSGMLSEVLSLKPHLQKRVRTLKEDHDRIRPRLREVMAAVEEQVYLPEIDAEMLRGLTGAVVSEVRRHESKGYDLVHEAFNRVDGFD
jgi:hypothetical protein